MDKRGMTMRAPKIQHGFSPRGSGPHFFCIGPAKSATTWLADHLKLHLDIWLPPIQEISYLSSGFEEHRGSVHLEYRWDRWSVLKRIVRNKSLMGWRDRQFYEAARELAAKSDAVFDLDGYVRLFAAASGKLTGDISPSYAAMTQAQIRRALPVLKHHRILMIARDPVARFWSHLSMLYRARSYGDVDYGSIETAQRFFHEPLRSRHHFPTRILDMWESELGPGTIEVFFFDDIAQRPAESLRRIVDFIGADYGKRIPLVSASRNRNRGEQRAHPSAEARQWINEAFHEELERCASRFGDHGRAWLSGHSADDR
jgi:hypothetical protein